MKNFLKGVMILLFVLLIFWAGYTVGTNRMDQEDFGDSAAFYAEILEIDGRSMLVSGLKENDVNYRGEFSFQVTADTKIEWHHTDIALTELMPGQHVSITFSGGVQESYPAQIQDVSRIILLDDANPLRDKAEISSIKNYYMNAEELGKTEQSLPCLTLLDKENFVFSYDVLSSYIPMGTYEITDGELIATDKEKGSRYVFEVVDENTLKFIQEKSADVSLTEENAGAVITDGALFERKQV